MCVTLVWVLLHAQLSAFCFYHPYRRCIVLYRGLPLNNFYMNEAVLQVRIYWANVSLKNNVSCCSSFPCPSSGAFVVNQDHCAKSYMNTEHKANPCPKVFIKWKIDGDRRKGILGHTKQQCDTIHPSDKQWLWNTFVTEKERCVIVVTVIIVIQSHNHPKNIYIKI